MVPTAFMRGIVLLTVGLMQPLNCLNKDRLFINPCLSLSEAEEILGQAAHLTQSDHENNEEVKRYRCVYQAADSSQRSNLYYILEVYKDSVSAHRAYTEILDANSSMPGQNVVHNIGEEAWQHSDGKHFRLIIFRRENMMVRIKVNKITKASSLSSLREVAMAIDTRIKHE